MSSPMYAMSEETTYKVESDQRQMKKAKKPGFIKRWLHKIAEESWNKKRQEQEYEAVNMGSARQIKGLQINNAPSIDQPERAIHFTVYNATGGRIVETRRYDRQKDRNNTGLYVITGDQDFGREIDKIIVMEGLK